MDCCTLDIFHVEGATEVDDRWVDALARRICNVVVEASFLLPNGVPADGRKQLAADFGTLGSPIVPMHPLSICGVSHLGTCLWGAAAQTMFATC